MLHDVVTTLAPPLSAPQARPASPATLIALVALTKPQLAFMTVLTAMVAYGTARPAAGSALSTLLGTTLAAAGALSLNQWWERRADAQMQRTRGRPLPQAPGHAGCRPRLEPRALVCRRRRTGGAGQSHRCGDRRPDDFDLWTRLYAAQASHALGDRTRRGVRRPAAVAG